MNLVLLLPAALAALAALLLPLLLHLARRTERRPVDFAAWRALAERVRPRRNIRFDDWPLLLARLLLLALLALLLARPALVGGGAPADWVVALPGVPATALREARIDGAGDGGAVERRWLGDGFPASTDAAPAASQPVASLLRELDATLPADARLTVLAPPVLDGADAERPRLSRAVDWRVVADAAPAVAPRRTAMPPRLAIRHDATHAGAVRYLRAAAMAWRATTPDATIDVAGLDAALPARDHVLVWLASGPLPEPVRDWITAGGTALLAAPIALPRDASTCPRWRDGAGSVVIESVASGDLRMLRFATPLSPDRMPALLEPEFAAGLREAIAPAPAPRLADARAWSPAAGAKAWPPAPRELAPWLLLAIALAFVLERWLAAGPRRQVAG